eukprot:4441245-Pyramimonas_sp.AAC.1
MVNFPPVVGLDPRRTPLGPLLDPLWTPFGPAGRAILGGGGVEEAAVKWLSIRIGFGTKLTIGMRNSLYR